MANSMAATTFEAAHRPGPGAAAASAANTPGHWRAGPHRGTEAAAQANTAQPQGLQQPQPAIGGHGIGHTAPGGISAGPPEPLQKPTAPAPAQPLPQQETHPMAAFPPAGSSAAQPQGLQQPQPATGGPDDDDDDDEDLQDPAAEESDWTT